MQQGSIFKDNKAVLNLVIINVVLFIAKMMMPDLIHSPLPHERFTFLDQYLSLHYFLGDGFYPWQIITHMFMHGNTSHILFNMFALFTFGSLLEKVWGPKRFLFFYFTCGIGGVLFHEAYQAYLAYHATGGFSLLGQGEGAFTGICEGASGAVFGVSAGLTLLFPNLELYLFFVPIPLKAKYVIPGYLLLEIYLGISGGGAGVAHWAHIGGAFVGVLMVLYWRKDRTRFY